MNLSERIQMARKQAKLTQKELADRIGISQTAVHKLEAGRSQRSRKTVSIALTCGVDPIWLDTGRGEMSLVGAIPGMDQADLAKAAEEGGLKRAPIFARMPLIPWGNTLRYANEPVEAIHHNNVETWIPVAPRSSEQSFALTVQDDSMEPEFMEGEVVIIDPTIEASHNKYVVAIATGSQEPTLKQLFIIGQKHYLKPLNDRYPLVEPDGKPTIIGVVVSKYKQY